MINKAILQQRDLMRRAVSILDTMERDFGFWQAIDMDYAETRKAKAIKAYGAAMANLVTLLDEQMDLAGLMKVNEPELKSVVEIAEEVLA